MNPYIKYISKSSIGSWDKDPMSSYEALSLPAKWKYLLAQSLMVNYLDRMFSAEGNPLLKSYRDFLRALTKKSLYELNVRDVNEVADLRSTAKNCEYLLYPINTDGNAPLRHEVDEVQMVETLFGDTNNKEEMPFPLEANFAIPYIKFINATAGIVSDDKRYVNVDSAVSSYGSNALIPAAQIWERVIYVSFVGGNSNNNKFLTFDLDTKMVNQPEFKAYTGLQWLSCFHYNGWDINEVLGMIAGLSFSQDELSLVTPTAQLFYRLFATVFEMKPAFERRWYLDKSMRLAIARFVVLVYERDHISIEDRAILARIMEADNETERKLSEYFSTADATVVGVEAYQAFQKSEFGKIRELDISFFKDAAGDEQPDVPTGNQEEEKEVTVPSFNQGEDETATQPDAPEEAAPAEAGDDKQVEIPTDPTTTDDTEDPNATDTASNDNNDTTQQQQGPPQEDTSDKRGVRIVFVTPEEETADSILLKQELSNFINTILANPPKNLSPQKVQMLILVKKYLLNLLHVVSLRDIVAKATRLPVVFKKIQWSEK